jgi:hypothetical protein
MKARVLTLAALALGLAACDNSATAPAEAAGARFDTDAVCVEDGRGGHTLGGGNYAPGPCPTP